MLLSCASTVYIGHACSWMGVWVQHIQGPVPHTHTHIQCSNVTWQDQLKTSEVVDIILPLRGWLRSLSLPRCVRVCVCCVWEIVIHITLQYTFEQGYNKTILLQLWCKLKLYSDVKQAYLFHMHNVWCTVFYSIEGCNSRCVHPSVYIISISDRYMHIMF